MGRTLIQIINGLLLLLFATAAIVQYNDPDPILWVSAYGAGALCCALYLLDRLPVVLSGLVAGLCLLGALYLLVQIFFGPVAFFDTTGHEMMGLVEETREVFGFLIIALWAGFLTWQVRRSPQTSPPSPEPTT